MGREAGSRIDVLLPVLPFADVRMPTLGPSLLAAHARRAGFTAEVSYLNLDLGESLGPELYQQLSSGFSAETLVGEWFFARAAFGDDAPDEHYLEQVLLGKWCNDEPCDEEFAARLVAAREQAETYVEDCVARLAAQRPRVVGFSTMFHQTCACLAVARRLAALDEPPVVMFGGANCEGEMGRRLLRSFDAIDYVCTGEGDIAFPALLERVLRTPDAPIPPGVLARGGDDALLPAERFADMDAMPTPEYDDYFDRVRELPAIRDLDLRTIVETSRGCWWGAKSHCTFCGLNGATMSFRSKSPERAFEDIAEMVERYGTKLVWSADNILDLSYVDTLFPRLAEAEVGAELFYEVKANMKRAQLATMREGGVVRIQPGIESLDDDVLKLMRKGCTGLQNIQLLRWSAELGIRVSWNLLYGFPGESAESYSRMAAAVPLLSHLEPPIWAGAVRLDRFSPYFTAPDAYGITGLRPVPAYEHVFPLPQEDLHEIAYFFDHDAGFVTAPEYTHDLLHAAEAWLNGWQPGAAALDLFLLGDLAVINDTRPCAVAPTHHLGPLATSIYLLCDGARTAAGVVRDLPDGTSLEDVQAMLTDLVDRKLMLADGGRYLSLALFRSRPGETGGFWRAQLSGSAI